VTAVEVARSALFVPGDRPDRFDKAAATGALVVLDLEDAVVDAARPLARQHVRRWLEDRGRAVVRVQAADAPGHADDVGAVAGAVGLLGVVLARAERPEDIHAVGVAVTAPVIALIETAAGIAAARQLAARAARLALGDQDLALDLGVAPRSSTVRTLATEIVLASRLAGLPRPLDGVTPEIRDEDQLAKDAMTSRRDGFGGKLCIHPAQVATVERSFRPNDEELDWARSVVAAAAAADGRVAITAEGGMVDRPLVERARALLRDA
jgi:citrate lyase subunit beta/citryl-CoA lyase